MDPTCMECVKKGFAGYSDYSSRSRRKEFWYFYLALIIYELILNVISRILKIAIVSYICYVLLVIPILVFFLPLSVRRLHDTGRSGWWLLLDLTIIGGIVILVFCCLDSDPQNNEYGPSPKYGNQGQGLTES